VDIWVFNNSQKEKGSLVVLAHIFGRRKYKKPYKFREGNST